VCRDAIADRQAHRPCQASSSRTWRRRTGTWLNIGAGTRPPLARRGRGCGGGYLGRQQGGGPRRREGTTALRCACACACHSAARRRHLKEALEHGETPCAAAATTATRWIMDGACTRRCDIHQHRARRRRRRRRARSARWTAPWGDGKWNSVHPGRYFIYRPGSRQCETSDHFHAARISQYQVRIRCILSVGRGFNGLGCSGGGR